MAKDELDQAIVDLEGKIDKLQALYNQYFMGIEKLQPTVMQTAVERTIRQLRKKPVPKTAQRFRLQTLFQRFNTLNNHWRRICREIEEGTYRRHLDRAKRRQEYKKQTETPQDPAVYSAKDTQEENAAYDLSDEFNDLLNGDGQSSFDMKDFGDFDLDEPFKQVSIDVKDAKEPPQKEIGTLDDPFGDSIWSATPSQKTPPRDQAQPAAPKATPPSKAAAKSSTGARSPRKPAPEDRTGRPSPSPSPMRREGENATNRPDSIDARRAQAIFRTFVAARSRCKERTDNLTLEKITKSLNKQFQARGGEVDFKVVIKNGKAAIKTVTKKNE